jgi:hypothetical protein
VQYLDDNATDGSGELSTPAGELIGRSPIHVYVLYLNSVPDTGCLSRWSDFFPSQILDPHQKI